MANGLKQPRASIACSRNRDPDYLLLASEGLEGLAAVALFDALLCAAKDQDNAGVFQIPPAVVAALVGIEFKTYSKLIQKLIKLGWVEESADSITVRSYTKWNPPDHRGGPRQNAGRPSRIGNQNEIKTNSNQPVIELPPSPSPSPLPTTTKRQPRKRGVDVGKVVIPPALIQFESAIRSWLVYRSERKPPIYETGLEALWRQLEGFGSDVPAVVDQAMASGWQGLFPLKAGYSPRAQTPKVSQEFSRGS